MNRLIPDLVHGLRRLRRSPAFTVVALLTLALGIGANTAIFSLVRTVVLRPLPYADPDRLVMIWGARDKGETTWLSVPEVVSYSTDASAFSAVAAYTSVAVNLTGGDQPERVVAASVTPNLFATLGVRPQIGRAFLATDSAAAIEDQVVLGYGIWQRRFGGRSDIIGQSIQLNARPRTVIGVMPAGFQLPLDFDDNRPSELWLPFDVTPSLASWGDHSLIGVARLRNGVAPSAATAAMRALEERWVRDGHWTNRHMNGRAAVRVSDLVIGDVREALWILLGAVAVILLIACANVANLMLARSDERHREVAIRTAIGASRATILRQLLTESVILALAGGAIGVALAYGGLRALLVLDPPGIPRVGDVSLDPAVLAFTLLLTMVTGTVFGLAPALDLSRPDVNRSLRDGGRTSSVSRGRQRFRDTLAAAQMALSVVLLIGAFLLVRSFLELRRIDLGFRTEQALTVRTTLPQATYPQAADVIAFHRTLRRRLAELPGVRSVGATRLLPLTGTIGDWSITLEGRPRQPNENPNGDWQVVTPGYFESMGMKLVRGRLPTDADQADAPLVAVVNETMASRYWPNEDPIGKRFHLGTDGRPWITIVGIVGAVRHNAVTESSRAEMYVPHAQWGAAGANPPRGLTYVLRTQGDPLAVLGYVRQAVRSLDPNLPLSDIQTLNAVASDALARPRFTTVMLGLFAVLALSIAGIGVYGVLALLVTRRRQEIGIRMALGARPKVIVRMVLRRGMVLTAVGVAIGLAASLVLTRLISSLLYGVTRFDLPTFTLVPLLLGAVALIACAVPAVRAAAVSPMTALREE